MDRGYVFLVMCFRCLTLLDWLEDVADVASFISTVDAHAYLYMSLRIVKNEDTWTLNLCSIAITFYRNY